MKGKFSLVWAILSIFPMYFTVSSTSYSAGSWCPYQVEKVVPCRVRNGTESFYGTNICWRNENGSYACTKKIMYRPRYITTYKKVREIKYKCCAGRDGPDCENECFNCTTFRKLEERLTAHERRLGRIEKSTGKNISPLGDHHPRYRDFSNENSVYPPSARPPENEGGSTSLSLAYATLNLRVQTILDEFREMQNRIRYLENEVVRLNNQLDSSLGSYDYTTGGGSSSDLYGNKDIRTSSTTDRNGKDSPVSSSQMTNDQGHLKKAGNEETEEAEVDPPENQETHPRRHHHHHHHSSSSSVKSDSPFRVLEENLERGDIASTLNDDYGDELYNDNSTEQYIDQLQTKREHHSP